MTPPKLPYASSTAGAAREREIRSILRDAGATAVGFMVDDDADTITAQFRLHGRTISVPIIVGNYAKAWLKENKLSSRSRTTEADHQKKARVQAENAAWAILADYIKAQAAMIVSGFMSADTAFLPHIHTPSGRRVEDVIADGSATALLPSPSTGDKDE